MGQFLKRIPFEKPLKVYMEESFVHGSSHRVSRYALCAIFDNLRDIFSFSSQMQIGRVAPLHDDPLLVIVFFLGDNLLSWSSKHQQTLSRSSAEAEYRGVANVVAKTTWLRNLLHELHSPLSSATLVYYDNFNAIYLFTNPVQHQRTKHIEIDIHFVRDLVTTGQSQHIILE
nr:NBS-containing resistance-like protein [Tanacetum cinerariifolium]